MTTHNLVPSNNKRRIYDQQNGLCAYCGQYRNMKSMTIDHIIPLSRGGADIPENLQCTCNSCNWLKGNKMPHEFTIFIRGMLENSMRIEKEVRKNKTDGSISPPF